MEGGVRFWYVGRLGLLKTLLLLSAHWDAKLKEELSFARRKFEGIHFADRTPTSFYPITHTHRLKSMYFEPLSTLSSFDGRSTYTLYICPFVLFFFRALPAQDTFCLPKYKNAQPPQPLEIEIRIAK